MKEILIINTGGTFNKVYNSLTGNLDIDLEGEALKDIAKHWLTNYKIVNIIGKDSLEMTNEDRIKIQKTIESSQVEHFIVIHGTDTMDKTAFQLSNIKNKTIILTGAMVPYSIKPIEATANLSSAYGYIQNIKENGVFIAMNGIIKDYKRVRKNKEKGYFE